MKSTKECKWYPVCPMKFQYENNNIDKYWIENFCHNNWKNCIRYQKEEAGIYHPDNMMPDGSINKKI